jgi:hypothetical protein
MLEAWVPVPFLLEPLASRSTPGLIRISMASFAMTRFTSFTEDDGVLSHVTGSGGMIKLAVIIVCLWTVAVAVASCCCLIGCLPGRHEVGRLYVQKEMQDKTHALKIQDIAEKGRVQKEMKDKMCQSPTTYTRHNAEPRFKPLGAGEHGCW